MNSRHMTGAFQVVKDFEDAIAVYTGAPYVVTTTSCTMALTLAVAYHLDQLGMGYRELLQNRRPPIEIPKRTYVGVPYAIREAGARITFRDEDWTGCYQLRPLPVWDSARWFTEGLYRATHIPGGNGRWFLPGSMVCVSFHWSKTLGIQQGGAILHDSDQADEWLRRARFDGRAQGVAPAMDRFPLKRAWHAYMSPETAAAGLVRMGIIARHNDPIPNDNYPDLSLVEAFQ